jgi:hypothetical protein
VYQHAERPPEHHREVSAQAHQLLVTQVQLQQLELVQAESGSLRARFDAAVAEARQASDAKALVAERRADALGEALNRRDAALPAARASAGPAAAANARTAAGRCEQVHLCGACQS